MGSYGIYEKTEQLTFTDNQTCSLEFEYFIFHFKSSE